MSNFTKWNVAYEIFRISPVSQFLWNLTFIFSVSHKKFSLVLLQVTNYIYSRWKCKREYNILQIILVEGFCLLKIIII